MFRKIIVSVILSLLVLSFGYAGFRYQVMTRKKTEKQEIPDRRPSVEVASFVSTQYTCKVMGYGNVTPKSKLTIFPDVAGTVSWVSDRFDTGNVVEEGEEIVKLDDLRLRNTVEATRASIAQLTHQLELLDKEKGNAEANVRLFTQMVELARDELDRNKRLAKKGSISQSAADKLESAYLGNLASLQGQKNVLATIEPRAATVRAQIDAAKARMAIDQDELGKAVIRAPFTGIVVEKSVEAGQVIGKNNALGMLFGIREARVQVPIPVADLKWLKNGTSVGLGHGLSLSYTGEALVIPEETSSTVAWPARIVSTGGRVDAKNRTFDIIVEVDDPLSPSEESGLTPLAMGLFCRVEFTGRTLSDVFVLPRACLYEDGTVKIVREGKIAIVHVEVIRVGDDRAVVRGEVNGFPVVLTRSDALVEGTEVRERPRG